MSSRKLIHAVFHCEECALFWEDYLTAAELARKHAKEHKHSVNGELGFSVRYESGK